MASHCFYKVTCAGKTVEKPLSAILPNRDRERQREHARSREREREREREKERERGHRYIETKIEDRKKNR